LLFQQKEQFFEEKRDLQESFDEAQTQICTLNEAIQQLRAQYDETLTSMQEEEDGAYAKEQRANALLEAKDRVIDDIGKEVEEYRRRMEKTKTDVPGHSQGAATFKAVTTKIDNIDSMMTVHRQKTEALRDEIDSVKQKQRRNNVLTKNLTAQAARHKHQYEDEKTENEQLRQVPCALLTVANTFVLLTPRSNRKTLVSQTKTASCKKKRRSC
jgi:chromosome segregation ATPase